MSNNKRAPKLPIEPTLSPRALNAVTHGIFSVAPVIPWFESEEDWINFRDGIFESLEPKNVLQETFAERVASIFWRMWRVVRHERESITYSIESVRRDYDTHAVLTGKEIPAETTPEVEKLLESMAMQRLIPDDATLNRVMRYETKLHRYLLQTLHQYHTLREGVRPYRNRTDIEMTDVRRIGVRSPKVTKPDRHH